MSETIPIASDHAGVEMKSRLVAELKRMGYQPDDLGSDDPSKPDDYPDYGHPLAREVSDGEAKRGILLCGSGVGMDIVANRYPHVRSALAWSPVLGGLSLGVFRNLIGQYIGFATPELRLPIAFVVLLLVLLVKPTGLFGRKQVRRV